MREANPDQHRRALTQSQSSSKCDRVCFPAPPRGEEHSLPEKGLTMRKIKAAVIGAGFMGRVHTEAIRRVGHVEVAVMAAQTEREAQGIARAIGIDRFTGDYSTVLSDPAIEAVHVCTPNALHYPVAKAALEA
ncbi:MAG TPA: hypothetical protein DEH78_22585, partial [Solibacterales bacterium]|nr:hypothetical protein [Bryobacterales bacterium]